MEPHAPSRMPLAIGAVLLYALVYGGSLAVFGRGPATIAAWLRSEVAAVVLLVVVLHGWTDLVPNLAPFVTTWIG